MFVNDRFNQSVFWVGELKLHAFLAFSQDEMRAAMKRLTDML